MDMCLNKLSDPPAPGWLGRLGRFPRDRGRLVDCLRAAIAILLRGWLRAYHRLSIDGSEHLPAQGSFVLVANHSSHLDTLCLQAAIPLSKLNQTYPAAAADYFFTSLARSAVAVLVVNALPFDRRAHLRQSLGVCRHLLATHGNILIVYPEGTRSTDGRMGTFRPGIGALLAETGVPVVPCYLDGTAAALAKGRWFPRPRGLHLVIGKPRSYPLVRGDKAGAHVVCRDLEGAVRELARPRSADEKLKLDLRTAKTA